MNFLFGISHLFNNIMQAPGRRYKWPWAPRRARRRTHGCPLASGSSSRLCIFKL